MLRSVCGQLLVHFLIQDHLDDAEDERIEDNVMKVGVRVPG